jgi:leucyl-tRNA synthetase
MELTNALQKASVDTDNDRSVIREGIEALILMLTPVTPHICHVLWQALGHSDVHNAPWPTADAEAMIEDEKLIIVQVNGKLRAKITVAADAAQADVEQIAMAEGNVQSFVDGKTIRKVIFVPGKLLNIVAN